MSLYRVTIIGHLGQDPELHHLPTNGQPVRSFLSQPMRSSRVRTVRAKRGSTGTNIVVFG
jgi:single-stranded DNA-binding protein